MAIIKVSIKNRDTLVLEEDGKKGDEIDLKDLVKVDQTFINKLIEDNKNELIASRIEDERIKLKQEFDKKLSESELELTRKYNNEKDSLGKTHQQEIDKIKAELNELKSKHQSLLDNNELSIQNKVNEVIVAKDKEISKLKTQILTDEKAFSLKKNEEFSEQEKHFTSEISKRETEIAKLSEQIKSLNATKEQEIKNIELQEKQKNADEIATLKQAISNLENDKKVYIAETDLKLTNKLQSQRDSLTEEFQKKLNVVEEKRKEFEEKYNQLSLSKSSLNVKKLGEELEKWCNSEFEEARQYGFENTEWYKDNDAIKDENESKGSKADYIFKVYSSSDFNSETLLASVCLEMKNESNISTNTKKNSDHYAKLEKDRIKKNCEYALLVSELEWDTNNDVPVRKVLGYDKMYVVRPQYMISFLSLIYALSNKYKDLLNEEIKEKLELKSSIEIKDEFEKFKKTYLEDQIVSFAKDIEKLRDNNKKILENANKNSELLDKLIETKIETMKEKIERFDIKKIARKLDKLTF